MRADASNNTWQRDLSAVDVNVEDIVLAQGDGLGALKAYQASVAVRVPLVALGSGNKQWMDDLGGMAFKLISARDFAAALDLVDRSIARESNEIFFYNNRAHAVMFLGRTDEERALLNQTNPNERAPKGVSCGNPTLVSADPYPADRYHTTVSR